VAVTIVDGNGDGAEFETELWNRGPEGWEDQVSSGGLSFGMGSVLETGAMIGGVGVAEANETVTVRFRGSTYECKANELGYWGFVHRCDDLSEHAQVFR
jgi:hypothetical protein